MRRRLRELLDRLRDWRNRPGPGRHAYTELQIIDMRLHTPDGPEQPPLRAAGAPITQADADDAEIEFTLALRRAMYPRLYWPAEDYWRECWRDFCIKGAQMTARVNAERRTWRAECGLPPTDEFPTLPMLSLSAVA